MTGSFYARRILPCLIDLGMRGKEATRFRARVVPQARGTALEVGVGSGLNLPFYGARVERLIALDPSEELLRMAKRRARGVAFPLELMARSGEVLPLPDASIDTVVFTFTLCTIPDPLAALREARRVLKVSGELLFAEHGLAPEPGVQRWQQRLNPFWRRVAGGCNLDRKIDEVIQAAGFGFASLQKEYARGPRLMSYIYFGRAQPS